ncbi:MAG TPA: TIGR03668 family PPOX class F420-dependent oxidoreductase [Pedococcus sp.]|uniref:TIGR03668 family PPOX class F420-dependent oxidoreductase n=1 Tax=Pedococcus sp. TaxID=2860345 RepID=UPI002F9482CE
MQSWARERFAAAPVARLATVTAAGRPHLVPVAFVLVGDTVWTAVDQKPKTTRSLHRLANIEAHPRVSLLADHYDDDWSRLWWVRADGHASVVELAGTDATAALSSLVAKYPQYRADPPTGPLIRIAVDTWRSWSAG